MAESDPSKPRKLAAKAGAGESGAGNPGSPGNPGAGNAGSAGDPGAGGTGTGNETGTAGSAPPSASGGHAPARPQRPALPSRADSQARLDQEVDRALRYHHSLSIALVDIDAISSGMSARRSAGDVDRVLSYFVRRATSVLRDCDALSYWDGPLLLWILPETELDAAVLACERLRRASSSVVIGELPPLTLSMGVAELELGEDAACLVKRAADALLLSQARGRNCVTRADVIRRPEAGAGD